MRSTLLAALALLLLGASVSAQTFTVNDDGPADFAQVSEALASPIVQDGAVLLVSRGHYARFAAHKAVTILGIGDSGGIVSFEDGPLSIVHSIGAGKQFTLANARVGVLSLQDSEGTIVLSHVTAGSLLLTAAKDVRLDRVRVQPVGIDVVDSHVLMAKSIVDGSFMNKSDEGLIRVDETSSAHIALCQIIGAQGSDFELNPAHHTGFDGEIGISIRGNVVLTGNNLSSVEGGDGGNGCCGAPDGNGAPAIRVEAGGILRHSGVRIEGGKGPSFVSAPDIVALGSVEESPSPDPTLHLFGFMTAGSSVSPIVTAPDTSFALVFAGLVPVVDVLDGILGELGTQFVTTIGTGVPTPSTRFPTTVPELWLDVVVPHDLAPGVTFHVQAIAFYLEPPSIRLSNTVPAVVR